MAKALFFGAVALVEIIIAVLLFRIGRVVLPLVLTLAAFCFIMTAIGHARAASRGKPGG